MHEHSYLFMFFAGFFYFVNPSEARAVVCLPQYIRKGRFKRRSNNSYAYTIKPHCPHAYYWILYLSNYRAVRAPIYIKRKKKCPIHDSRSSRKLPYSLIENWNNRENKKKKTYTIRPFVLRDIRRSGGKL